MTVLTLAATSINIDAGPGIKIEVVNGYSLKIGLDIGMIPSYTSYNGSSSSNFALPCNQILATDNFGRLCLMNLPPGNPTDWEEQKIRDTNPMVKDAWEEAKKSYNEYLLRLRLSRK